MSRREVFAEHASEQMWVEGESTFDDSNILVTISNPLGEHTALITPTVIVESKAKLFVEAPEERIATKEHAFAGSILKSLKLVGYVLAAVLISFSALSVSGAVKARIVLTGSMAPAINPGDIILTTTVDRLTPKKGDVVAYTARRFNGDPVGIFSHRIIGGNAKDGFLVKGDANKSPDIQKPTPKDIVGVVFFVLPFIGTLLTPKALFVIVPCAFGFWLVIDALRNEK